MTDKLWIVNSKTKNHDSPYEVQSYSKQLVSAQAFTLSLKTIMIADDLDGFPRGDNDLLLTTSAALGETPKVQRIHYYAEEIKRNIVLNNFIADNMFICEDYSGTDRLWIELKVTEVDTASGDRKALINAINKLAQVAGALYPVAMPYAAIASGLAGAIEKLISSLERNSSALECPIAFYPKDRADAGAPLQTGTYVVFAQDADGSKYQMESGHKLKRLDGENVNLSYAIFMIEAGKNVSSKWVISQKVATLLTQMEKGNENARDSTIDFLTDTLQQYSNFKDLQRYAELKSKDNLTEEEKQLIQQIAKREELKPFLPK